jgi:hypothetical protein
MFYDHLSLPITEICSPFFPGSISICHFYTPVCVYAICPYLCSASLSTVRAINELWSAAGFHQQNHCCNTQFDVGEGILTKYHMLKEVLIHMLRVPKVPSPPISIEEDISFVLSTSSLFALPSNYFPIFESVVNRLNV